MGHSNVDVENPYKSWEVERDWAMDLDLDFFVEVGGMTQGTSIPTFLGILKIAVKKPGKHSGTYKSFLEAIGSLVLRGYKLMKMNSNLFSLYIYVYYDIIYVRSCTNKSWFTMGKIIITYFTCIGTFKT